MMPITHIQTPFPEKFGVPRQGLLVPEALGVMSFPKNDFYSEAFRGIDESSHLWLIFEFHLVPSVDFQGLVRPPRFDGKKKMGVFATRSPFRPNRIGMSLVKFQELKMLNDSIELIVSGVDLVSGTPIFDIKPYVPYSDSIDARSPFDQAPEFKSVRWNCEKVPEWELIEKVIALDPRPGHDKNQDQEFGVSLAGWNVRFRFIEEGFEILSVLPALK